MSKGSWGAEFLVHVSSVNDFVDEEAVYYHTFIKPISFQTPKSEIFKDRYA